MEITKPPAELMCECGHERTWHKDFTSIGGDKGCTIIGCKCKKGPHEAPSAHGSCLVCGWDKPYAVWNGNHPEIGVCFECRDACHRHYRRKEMIFKLGVADTLTPEQIAAMYPTGDEGRA